MKTKIVITLLTAALLGLASTAQAGDRYRGHQGPGHYRGYATSSHHRYDRRHGYRAYGHHYAPRYYNSYGHGHYRYYGHHGYYDAAKIAAGAVLLGSIIHSANQDRPDRVVYTGRRYPVSTSNTGRQDTWYRTDSSGDCFEVRLNGDGNEVWTYVDSSYCQ